MDLKQKADQIREDILRVSVKNGAGHIAPSLSAVDILVALYYEVMNYDRSNPEWEDRDRMILSKSHGCYGVYSILADIGVLPKNEWDSFYTPESSLLGCMERRPEYGFEASCGSLGHGLPMAVGLAHGALLQGKTYRVYCIVGDGEMQEGSMWEALIFAVKHRLWNLTVIIDNNGLQAMDEIVNVLDESEKALIQRVNGFGANVHECNGHDIDELLGVFRTIEGLPREKPNIVVAKTIKGYGMTCMENVPKFHFRLPTSEELQQGRIAYGE